MKKICVIGGGRWGQNHIKTLYKSGNLAGIVESNETRLQELLQIYPVKGFIDIYDAATRKFDGYVIATPASTHFNIANVLLHLKLNVLIEKPMTLNSEQASELVAISRKTGAKLMVGHVLLFHPAIKKIKSLVDEGKIGKLHYLYSTRLNLGTVRTEENVFWSFAPHDISVLDYLVGHPVKSIEAKGSKFLQKDVYDFTMAQLSYPDNVQGHIFVSWLHPYKEQKLVLIGSEGMISFDDSTPEKEIYYYNKRINFVEGLPEKEEHPTEVILYDKTMPLSEELNYFITHLDTGIEIADGQSGYEVVKVLESVQQLIDK
jgi:UDP-2-acetamido-3-amino-2,3-dideoxy-glucuronate N-acetyltransferase